MRRILIAAALACGLCIGLSVRAADKDKKDKEIKGVLIDQMCGEKQMAKANPEESATNHPKTCALKESCANSGFAVISGKKMYKLDDASADKAKEYLAVKENATKVVVMGSLSDDGKTLHVSSIKAAADKDKKKTT